MKKIRVCTLCSGYDSQMMALRRCANVEADLVYWSEIDKDAIKAHNAIFPEYKDRNLGDMTKIDWSTKEDFDLLTYSTPCTSLSNAGKQEGMVKDSGTESSIIWSVEDCIKMKRPKYLLFENVKNIISKKFINDFESWCKLLESYGYTNYYQIMNAKDHNVVQNRERLYMVSVLGEHKKFTFPETEPLTQTLDDVMEQEVDDKYYIKKDVLSSFIKEEVEKKKQNEKELQITFLE